jgi:hypothetical protein
LPPEIPLQADRRPDVFIILKAGEPAPVASGSLDRCRLAPAPYLALVFHELAGMTPFANQLRRPTYLVY